MGMPTYNFFSVLGFPAQTGSLCNMREVIGRLQVDKMTRDEFLLHVFVHIHVVKKTSVKVIDWTESVLGLGLIMSTSRTIFSATSYNHSCESW